MNLTARDDSCQRYDERGEISAETNCSVEKTSLCLMSSLESFPRMKELFCLMQEKKITVYSSNENQTKTRKNLLSGMKTLLQHYNGSVWFDYIMHLVFVGLGW